MADPWLETRTSLLVRLRHHTDAASWDEFVDAYGRIIHALALKAGLSPEDAEDATQDTLATLARLLPEFRYNPSRGSFKSWVLTIARSKIIDTHRRRHRSRTFETPPPSHPGDTAFLEEIPDAAQLPPDQVMEETWRQGLLDAAHDQVRRQLSPRQYQIYDLHVVREWPVGKVAQTLNVSANQVYLAKHRVGEAIATEVTRLAQGAVG